MNEDKELDVIFPLLLTNMGYKVLSTPRASKGQLQDGKDIIAIGKDEHNKKIKLFIELKGFGQRDITDTNIYAIDGFRESVLAAKDVDYKDYGVAGLDLLPTKIIYAHPGELQPNANAKYNGIIQREFDGEELIFERWGIEKLIALFSEYLFNEYILVNDENKRLLQRTLVLLDAPDYDRGDFKLLVDNYLDSIDGAKMSKNKRQRENFFGTLVLLVSMILSYSKKNNNIIPAKDCVDYTVLKTWAYILRFKLEKKSAILGLFGKLLNIQWEIYSLYYQKTLDIAQTKNGLCILGISSESIGYPIRCFNYINDLIYFFKLVSNPLMIDEIGCHELKGVLKNIIRNNEGCKRPLLDNHSISILNVFNYIGRGEMTDDDCKFLSSYLSDIVYNIVLISRHKDRLPEIHSDEIALAKSSFTRSEDYCDSTSLLIPILLELCCWMGREDLYKALYDCVKERKVDLQVIYPNTEEYDIEQLLFERKFDEEFFCDCLLDMRELPKTIAKFKRQYKKHYSPIKFRTPMGYLYFLQTLAHNYYKTEHFPEFFNVGFFRADRKAVKS